MNDAEYMQYMTQLGQLCGMIEQLPLEQLASDLARVEAVAPIMDPTSYRSGGMDNIADQQRLLRVAMDLANTVRAIKQAGENRARAKVWNRTFGPSHG